MKNNFFHKNNYHLTSLYICCLVGRKVFINAIKKMLERYKRKSYEFAQNILENRRYWESKKIKRKSVGERHEITFLVYGDVSFMYCA